MYNYFHKRCSECEIKRHRVRTGQNGSNFVGSPFCDMDLELKGQISPKNTFSDKHFLSWWSTCAVNRSVLPHLTLNKLYQTLLFWTESIGGLEYNTQNIKNTLTKNASCVIFKSLFYWVGWLWMEIVITNALFEPTSPWQYFFECIRIFLYKSFYSL